MATPLHVQIAMHYHCRTDQYEMVLTNETRRRYAEDLVDVGMLARIGESGSDAVVGYRSTDGLKVWIEAICSVPVPVQQWVIPSPPSSTSLSEGV
jgi:hypothetical protein